MEWFIKMNEAINYIESHIQDEIDYTQIAAIACYSVSQFQKMFMFVTNISISEYIRRRRMSLAAHELINRDIKIIDLSYKYGYESPEAFTRAFQAFHGIPPTSVRKTGMYKEYSRILFQLKITGGHFNMENTPQFTTYKNITVKVEYMTIEESFKFIGLGNKGLNPFENIGIFKDKYKNIVANNMHDYMEFGMWTNLPDGNDFDYFYGVQVNDLNIIPDGLTGFDTQTYRFAVMSVGANSVFELVGDEKGPGDAMETAGEYTKNIWMPEHKGLAILDENGDFGKVIVDGKIYHTGCFEAYPKKFEDAIEMQFYIPLK